MASSVRVLDRAVRVADGWLWASDHAGVMTTIEVATGPARPEGVDE